MTQPRIELKRILDAAKEIDSNSLPLRIGHVNESFPELCDVEDANGVSVMDNSLPQWRAFLMTVNPQVVITLVESLVKAREALSRQKKCWHNNEIGCLAECSITCVALSDLDSAISFEGEGNATT